MPMNEPRITYKNNHKKHYAATDRSHNHTQQQGKVEEVALLKTVSKKPELHCTLNLIVAEMRCQWMNTPNLNQ